MRISWSVSLIWYVLCRKFNFILKRLLEFHQTKVLSDGNSTRHNARYLSLENTFSLSVVQFKPASRKYFITTQFNVVYYDVVVNIYF